MTVKREVWFNRVFLTNYMPCDRKGWLVTAVFAFFNLIGIVLAQSTEYDSAWSILLLSLPAGTWFVAMAIRHS
jgi:hypothetical protein